ncbi:unnamed protein product [Brassica rapa subsp. trilocularis]
MVKSKSKKKKKFVSQPTSHELVIGDLYFVYLNSFLLSRVVDL